MTRKRKEPYTETYSGRFAIRLKELREKAGLTVEQAAESMGISNKTLYSWESAHRFPHITDFQKISKTYKLKRVKDLLQNE